MPRETVQHGKYGAQGVHGGRAMFNQLDELARGIKSDVETERGLAARLHYLTKSERGYEAMERANINVSQRTLASWLAEDHAPSKANRAKIDEAYHALRRENVSTRLKRMLNKNGQGTRIEINPEDQSTVEPKYRRDLTTRQVNIRDWDDIIDAWEADDVEAAEWIWENDIVGDIDSPPDGYHYVANVGF